MMRAWGMSLVALTTVCLVATAIFSDDLVIAGGLFVGGLGLVLGGRAA